MRASLTHPILCFIAVDVAVFQGAMQVGVRHVLYVKVTMVVVVVVVFLCSETKGRSESTTLADRYTLISYRARMPPCPISGKSGHISANLLRDS